LAELDSTDFFRIMVAGITTKIRRVRSETWLALCQPV